MLMFSARTEAGKIQFNEDIRPVLNKHCVSCHGGVKKAGNLSFLARHSALAKGKSGLHAIIPGDAANSHILERIVSPDPDEHMPPVEHGPALSAEEVATLRQWIAEGAEWQNHWAFEPPLSAAPPDVSDPGWCQTPIDQFVLHRLDEEGLKPSPQADNATLLRRLCFDLTGLPPTIEQLDRFLADTRKDAFANAVDELLDAPEFGERWAAMWLDLARYADSEGLGVDSRRDTWAYRDWVIDAFNRNLPFDQFTIEQLAGDLLPDPTIDQLVATAFHRQTQSNGEGGTDDEEFRVAAVLDRTSTTWEAFQGVTFGCVQCHSHPYDPIANDEFYKFTAFFNNTADADLGDHWPQLRVPKDRSDYAKAKQLRDHAALVSEELTAEARRRMAQTAWISPAAESISATSSGNGVRIVANGGTSEFIAEGNIAAGTEYTFEFSPPTNLESLTALRIEQMPVDEAKARHTPEWGGILSRITLKVKAPGAQEFVPVGLAEVVGDEADPVYDPNDSLKKGGSGFGAMSKIFRRRTCVVLPTQPLKLEKGAVLQLKLQHDIQALGAFPLVTKRGAFSITDDEQWTEFAGSSEWNELRQELTEARRKLRDIPASTVPVMQERPLHLQRETRIFNRGNWLEKGDVVSADVPAFLPPLPKDAPKDRLALARWLVSKDNPLTARVAVNRFWEQLFGYGIVLTLEDFGAAGEKPSHPELLDWLAIHFRDDLQWNVKALLRDIVTSAVYQQTAAAGEELHERDPQNRLLARGPRKRVNAEMVRDFALTASGQLTRKQHGSPVRPPIPDGVWKPFANDPWKTEKDVERYRRSIYVYWKRSIPFPSFATFDAPSRELCNQRRLPSNTPLQALVTLNDPVFVEAANALADRMAAHSPDLAQQLRLGYRVCTSHELDAARMAQLMKLHDRLLQTYRADKPEGIADYDKAALQSLATVLLNLDESLTK
ncbi:MAG: PSD1 and planctomycete cytochrome C domain-containing protein [Verrucomicrobiales bacterium]